MNVTFAPGPSEPYPKLKTFMDDVINHKVASMSHRSEDFKKLFQTTTAEIRELLGVPDDYHVWFVGSATAAMERILQNTVKNSSHHFVNGAFSDKFMKIAKQLGKNPTETRVDWGAGFYLETEKIPDEAEAIMITQNETSTGAMLPNEHIQTIKKSYPDKLLVVDIVSAMPHLELDFSSVDCAFFSIQKGLGLPSGLGVIIASPRAMAKAEKLHAEGENVGSFHSFVSLKNNADKFSTPETPNIIGIYLLHRTIQDIIVGDVQKTRLKLSSNAEKLYKLVNSHSKLSLQVTNPEFQSSTVIVAEVDGGSDSLIVFAKERGFVLGKGYKHQASTHIRIANFIAHDQYIDELIDIMNKWQG